MSKNETLIELLNCPQCKDDFDVGPSYAGKLVCYDCECGAGPDEFKQSDNEARAAWNDYVKNNTHM